VPNASTADGDEALRLHFEGAVAVGAGRLRIAPEPIPRAPFDYPALLERVVGRYQQIVDLARPYRLKVVIETHMGSLAASPGLAWNICRHFDPGDLGVIFDLANFPREGNVDPCLGVSVLRPYIDHVHIGGSRRVGGGYDARGVRQMSNQFCPLSESDLYTPAWLGALRDAGVSAPLIIEDYTENVPSQQRLADAVGTLRRMLAGVA
jgi:sugar phosphate isomerase/epimerase